MYRITIFSVGKTKESWLLEALKEYEKRLTGHTEIIWILAKDSKHLKMLLEKEGAFIALTPEAKLLNSEQFSQKISAYLEQFGSRLTFVIGGAEGLDQELLKKAFDTLSLSPLTFTHQITRLILIEQLYRASEIQRGSKYHK